MPSTLVDNICDFREFLCDHNNFFCFIYFCGTKIKSLILAYLFFCLKKKHYLCSQN